MNIEVDKKQEKVFLYGLYTYVIILLDGYHIIRKLCHLVILHMNIYQ